MKRLKAILSASGLVLLAVSLPREPLQKSLANDRIMMHKDMA